ncbi:MULTISPECIES: CPXCG motif-containing cysteine-rich protein [Cobetia]|uniref:CPXCG motif-containing cysteine-rich protein n=1 Tax=Cobetia TaxID=204286 RepID=UPI00129911C8|nr:MULTISPECIES: CPXCG motif-containing cysteine-rich protein [Cobetia]MBR9796987.1 CPXCG motif-containing cysteine-rich protein [Gammaproteobacteria bacterium]MCK8069256.1 CPXCG motif-containing cysteine-rich protein [Cobetia sp. 1CM21F]MDH2297287.1 CPXCG motif-containing cysteine-rich protein [Cobetia sp. 29-18-1]WOI25814.1 CPXCG motif-containing cysteine-rich protein [Cobetia amphilecti]BBO57862.1 hypothetical protein CLAM6_31730 [Cobetia sp. AM6]
MNEQGRRPSESGELPEDDEVLDAAVEQWLAEHSSGQSDEWPGHELLEDKQEGVVNEALHEAEINCPYCDTPFTVFLDLDEGSLTNIIDCERCCQPIQVRQQVDPVSGELEGLDIGQDDDVL